MHFGRFRARSIAVPGHLLLPHLAIFIQCLYLVPCPTLIIMQIQRLNMDNSWHIRIGHMSLLIDPWLEGKEIDFFPWFNTQWHRTKPIDYTAVPDYHAVLITQKYPDHFHKQTLLRLKPECIIAPSSIETQIKTLLPSAKVISLDKRNTECTLNGVQIHWYPSRRKIDPIYDAFLIRDEHKSIFLAPHGYDIKDTDKTIHTPVTLLICPFNHYQLPVVLGGTVSPGIQGLIQMAQKLDPKQIVATHDEDKHARGLVSKLARIKRTKVSDLSSISILSGRILDLTDYKPVTL